jgi:hypothetical protein
MGNLTHEIRSDDATSDASLAKVDMKLEVVIIPVADVDRAKEFYKKLGWRLDVTPPGVVPARFRRGVRGAEEAVCSQNRLVSPRRFSGSGPQST